jgi:putative ABC transport system permease protein
MPVFLSRFLERQPLLLAMGEAVGMGLQSIRAYKMRAFLTILGVVMGIMTVTGMSSIVAGLNANVAQSVAKIGSSTIFIRPFAPGERVDDDEWRRRKAITLDEVEAIAKKPSVAAICPIQIVNVDAVKYGAEQAEGVQVLGTTAEYTTVHESWVEKGRFLSPHDVSSGRKVAVIGPDIQDALFPFVDPIGKELSLDGRRFEVVGVLNRKGKFLWMTMDNYVLIPVNSLQRQDRRFNFMVANMKAASPTQIERAIDDATEAMRRVRKLKFTQRNNFAVFAQDTFTNLYNQLTGGIYMVMIAISSIGLLVGGVGVMNIMLVSVTERTREIGVRLAIGALEREVLLQFLIEAVALAALGGLIGIVLATAASIALAQVMQIPYRFDAGINLLSFAFSALIGVVFGYFPARRAARLDPLDALRHE